MSSVIGTVGLNKKNMPNDMTTHKLHKDETVALYVHKMVLLRWQGQKLFCLMSTVRYKVHVTNTGKKKGRKNGNVTVKPEVVIVYNRRMEGFDKMYQQLASFLILM